MHVREAYNRGYEARKCRYLGKDILCSWVIEICSKSMDFVGIHGSISLLFFALFSTMILRYLTSVSYPSRLANRIQILKMSEAFSGISDFALYVRKNEASKEELMEYYGLHDMPHIRPYGRIGFFPRSFFAALALARQVRKEPEGAIFYIREIRLTYFLSFLSKKFSLSFYFECHALGKAPRFMYRRVFQKAKGIVSTNKAKVDHIKEMYHVSSERMIAVPNGFDEKLFLSTISREDARERCGLPDNRKIVLYSGSVQKWKGAYLIEEIASAFPDYLFVILGANKNDAVGNVRYIQSRPYAEVPLYLRSADILLAPYEQIEERALYYFSPIKLFEYMASGTPCIVTDLPAIREVVSEHEVTFSRFSKEGFIEAINDVFAEYDKALGRAKSAKEISMAYTWRSRAERILSWMQNI